MPEFTTTLTASAVALAALTIISLAALRGWKDWIGLKREELHQLADHAHAGAMPATGSRIEIADLKERIRKLEAIAAGVDL